MEYSTRKLKTSNFTYYYASTMPSTIPSIVAVALRDFSKETMITGCQVKLNEVSKSAKFPAASATFNKAMVAIVAHALHTNMARAGIGSGVRLSTASAVNLEPKNLDRPSCTAFENRDLCQVV